ncbi:restriction endonuclease subunit S [Halomonas sp. BC1]|uniref:restriction endonuclease subunit S n=1 Tax=Halomonas sp. BC1 TaxID=1670448 RepID=UPI0009BFFF32|nr:restriction endonuclease subunit S [Halomonas sp. BC1]
MTFSTIGDHVELQRGTTYKSALLDQPGPILLGLGSIERDGGFKSDKLRTYGGPSAEKLLVRPGDLYVSLKDVTQSGGLLGAIARVPESVSVGRMTQDTVKLIFKSSIPKEYFYWMLRTPQYRQYCRSHATGTTNLGLSREDFFAFKIPCLDEKKRLLVNALESIEGKVKLNGRINQTLEQLAQAIFKSWFVDFEPVKAKIAALEAGGSEEDALLAAMQAISGKGEEELTRLQAEQPEQYAELRATAELFPSAMQDSELGEIPEGWRVSQIGDEVTVVGGGTPSTKNPDFWDSGEINWTSPKDLSNLADKVLVETERKVTEAGLAKISSGLLPVDTVLMSSRAPVGYLALAKIPVAVNQGYIAMKCEKALSPEFVIQWCAAHMDEIKSRASGTTFAEISKKNFKIIPVVMPTESLISIYSKQASSLYKAIENNVRESDTLAKLRDSLLPKLLSGELSISNAEDQLAEEAEPAHV